MQRDRELARDIQFLERGGLKPKKSTLKRAKKDLPLSYPAVNDWSICLRKPVKTGNLWVEATATDTISEN
jgi:hypothetical protein